MEKPIPAELRTKAAQLVASVGESAALSTLRVGRNALARVLAGLPVKKSTAQLVGLSLGEGASSPTRPAKGPRP